MCCLHVQAFSSPRFLQPVTCTMSGRGPGGGGPVMMAVGGVVLGVIIWSIGWTIGVCCYRYRAKNAKPNVEFSCGRTSKVRRVQVIA